VSRHLQPDAQGLEDSRSSFSRVVPCIEFLLCTFRHIGAVLDSVLGTPTVQAEALGEASIAFLFGERLMRHGPGGINLHWYPRRERGGGRWFGWGMARRTGVSSGVLVGCNLLRRFAFDFSTMESIVNGSGEINVIVETIGRVVNH
jgi:hypothetical protein